ncbi:hypothetical protein ABT373_08660 [Streptomyces sp. NPDC000070]|uniref:hypothetical protein n=1 Tax=Streptomyces sp. NPDC000070 TaxID=3154240 RepID=UPI00332C944B
MTHMKRTATVLSSLALSVALLGGTAVADDTTPHTLPAYLSDRDNGDKDWDKDKDRDKDKCGHDSLGLTLLGIPLLAFFFPGDC